MSCIRMKPGPWRTTLMLRIGARAPLVNGGSHPWRAHLCTVLRLRASDRFFQALARKGMN